MARQMKLEVEKQNVQMKGEQTMTNEFNYFDYFKFNVLKGYYEQLLSGKKTDEVTFTVRNYDTQKSTYFYKAGALKFVKIEHTFDENGKQVVAVTVKDLNLDVKAKSKEGKEYSVFNTIDHGKAINAVRKALA